MTTGFSILLDWDDKDETQILSYPSPSFRQARLDAETKQKNRNDPRAKYTATRASRSSIRFKNKSYEIIRLLDQERVFVSHNNSKIDRSANISHIEILDCYGMPNKKIVEKLLLEKESK
jgi:hypothetical protein